jgi:hypothetical protein
MRKALFIVLGILAFFGLLTYLTLGGKRVRVEVCMEHSGRRACRIASGRDEATATRTAIDNACAEIAFGVTENGQCTRSNPVSSRVVE